jgi:hypothetical protein
MLSLLQEDLARAHLSQQLRTAERERLARYVAQVARTRRAQRKARRAAEQAQLRLRLLVG